MDVDVVDEDTSRTAYLVVVRSCVVAAVVLDKHTVHHNDKSRVGRGALDLRLRVCPAVSAGRLVNLKHIAVLGAVLELAVTLDHNNDS